ncbi:MAG: tetratricopeptide repeat protein [Phycisphaerae bacterium]|nr:tetratricopeptide repeat protein [Phycisphaerae bacterium]
MNRRLVVLVLVVAVSAIIGGGLFMLMRRPKDPTADIARAQELMAQAATDPAKYSEAIMVLKGSGGQNRGDVWMMLGECYRKLPQPDYRTALECYRNAVERSPENVEYRKEYLNMLIGGRMLSDALAQAQRLQALQPESAEPYRLMAQIEFLGSEMESGIVEKRRRMESALASADKAIAMAPGEMANYETKIVLLVSGSDAERMDENLGLAGATARAAAAACEDKAGAMLKVAAISAQHAAYLQASGKPRESEAKLKEASEAYRAVLSEDGKNVSALVGLGNIAIARAQREKGTAREKLYEEAEGHFRAAMAADPTNDAGYYGMAQLKAQEGQASEVIGVLREAMSKCTPTAELTEKTQIDMRRNVLAILANMLLEQVGDAGSADEARRWVDEMGKLEPVDEGVMAYLRGRLAARDGDLREAQGLLQKSVQLRPGNPEYHRRLAQIYQAQNLLGKARESYDEALRLLPGRLDIRLERAQLLLALRQFGQAESESRSIIASGNSYVAAMILAQSLTGQGKFGEALSVADQMIKLAEKMPQGYLLKSQILLSAGRQASEALGALTGGLDKQAEPRLPLYEEARRICAQYDLKDETQKLKQRIEGDASLTEGDRKRLALYDKTMADIPNELDQQIAADPQNPDPVIRKAMWYVHEGKIDEALDLYRKAYDLALSGKKDAQVRLVWDNVWTLLLTREGGRERAKEWIERLPSEMKTEREMADGLLTLMDGAEPPAEQIKGMSGTEQAAYRTGRINEAIRVFKDLESRDELGTDVRIMRALARAYSLLAMQGGADRAASLGHSEKYYLDLIRIQPQDLQSHYMLLDVYMQMPAYDRVVTQANELLKLSPNDVMALDRMAQARQIQGNRKEVVRLREQIRGVQPGNTANLYVLGQAQEATGDLAGAEKTYRDLLTIQPHQSDTTLALSLLLVRRGNGAEAEALMGDLEKALPSDAAALRALSVYWQNVGQFDKAVAYARRAQSSVAEPLAGDVLFTVSAYVTAGDASGTVDERTRMLTEAAGLLEGYLKKHPDEMVMRIQLADVLRRIPGRAADAESLTRDIVKSAPEAANARTLLGRILLDKALTAQANGRGTEFTESLAEARQVVSGVLNEQRTYGEARLLSGEIEMAGGNLSEAAVQLRQVGAEDRVYVQALAMLVEVSRRQGNQQTMVATLTELLKLQPQNINARLQLSSLFARDKAYDRVEQLMAEGLQYAPGHPQLELVLCQALLMQGDAGKASRALKIATGLTERLPGNSEVWGSWAAAKNALNQTAEATSKLEALAKEPPSAGTSASVAFGRLLATQYLRLDRRDDARKALEGLIQSHRQAPEVLPAYMDAYALLADGQKPGWSGEAIRLLEQALKDFPPSAQNGQSLVLSRYLGRMYLLEGKVGEARRVMQEALKVQPKFALVLVDLGELELSQKNVDAAIEKFEAAIALDPGLWGALNNLAWALATEKGDVASARTRIDQALRLQPRHSSLLDTSGWIHYLAGDYRSAERELEESLASSPSLVTKYHLGMTLAKRSEQTSSASAKADLQLRAKGLLGEFLAESKGPAHERERAEAEKVLKGL